WSRLRQLRWSALKRLDSVVENLAVDPAHRDVLHLGRRSSLFSSFLGPGALRCCGRVGEQLAEGLQEAGELLGHPAGQLRSLTAQQPGGRADRAPAASPRAAVDFATGAAAQVVLRAERERV